MMASILFAAGAFTGIMKGSGMLGAMAASMAHAVPPAGARHIPFALGLASMPLSLLFDPDSFYLGALPVIAEVGKNLHVPPIQIGQAALLGQMTTGFPVSPLTPAAFLVAGLGHRVWRTSAVHRAFFVRRVGPHDDRLHDTWSVSPVKMIRIGCGAGLSGDRNEPAVEPRDPWRPGLPRVLQLPLIERALNPPVGDEPHERDEHVDAVRDQLMHEGERDRRGV